MSPDASRRLVFLVPYPPPNSVLLGSAAAPALGGKGFESRLCDAFGLPGRPPVAALTRIADGGAPDEAWWLRADPVHLATTIDRILLNPHSLPVSQAEATALVAQIQQLFSADRWQFEVPHPGRWYLRLLESPGIETTPPRDAVGRDVGPLLPQEPEARRWRRYLTEVQMLLAMSATNAEREARGQLAVNSVWFWGEGRLPAVAPARRWQQVWSEDALARGLAAFTRTSIAPVPADARSWLEVAAPGDHLLVLSPDDNLDVTPASFWTDFERDWLVPLAAARRQGRVGAARLYGAEGPGYDLGARGGGWRRVRSLVRNWLPRLT